VPDLHLPKKGKVENQGTHGYEHDEEIKSYVRSNKEAFHGRIEFEKVGAITKVHAQT
jgi:hypothetical protein